MRIQVPHLLVPQFLHPCGRLARHNREQNGLAARAVQVEKEEKEAAVRGGERGTAEKVGFMARIVGMLFSG